MALVTRVTSQKLILVEDNLSSAGWPLFYSIVKSLSENRDFDVLFIDSGSSLPYVSFAAQHGFLSDAKPVDIFGGDSDWECSLEFLLNKLNTELPGSKKCLIVINSIADLVLAFGAHGVSVILAGLYQECEAIVVGLLHTDAISVHHAEALRYIASTVYRIESRTNASFTVNRQQRKNDGSIENSIEHVQLDQDYDIVKISAAKPNGKKETDRAISAESQVPTDVPFRLDLSVAEKEAKENLQLPYFAVQTPANTGFAIHYTPDDADDWDDEDPDADLDI